VIKLGLDIHAKATLLEDVFDESRAATSKVTLSDLAELLD